VSPIKNGEGTLVGFSKIIRDITSYKELESALQEKTEQLMHSNAELSLFASAVSHELQEPVRKIIGFGDMINTAKGTVSDELAQYVKRMKNAATRMQRLIEALLSMSRITTQTNPLIPVALDAVVREVMLDFAGPIKEEGGLVDIGPMPTVMADYLQMRQLFHNLISNAFKFRKKDEALQLKIFNNKREDGFVEINVQDNSIGFDAEFQNRIFKPFQRLHRRGEYEGSGLGLAICERIVLRHGGTISAKSELGKGTTFTVTLPA
jgi:light-regulated signal transduction histidine kinase (bacteriophytochrome)